MGIILNLNITRIYHLNKNISCQNRGKARDLIPIKKQNFKIKQLPSSRPTTISHMLINLADQLIYLILPISRISSVFEPFLLSLQHLFRIVQHEGAEETGDWLEMGTNSNNLIHNVFYAYDAMLTQFLQRAYYHVNATNQPILQKMTNRLAIPVPQCCYRLKESSPSQLSPHLSCRSSPSHSSHWDIYTRNNMFLDSRIENKVAVGN